MTPIDDNGGEVRGFYQLIPKKWEDDEWFKLWEKLAKEKEKSPPALEPAG